jgi:hypothetical protein
LEIAVLSCPFQTDVSLRSLLLSGRMHDDQLEVVEMEAKMEEVEYLCLELLEMDQATSKMVEEA